ncbi:hypothetical protein [Streptomyces sp. NPDC059994]|uniref:hypothetical protein n=1 Tax=Streptomyces sp. NPDC059994 TaxID=3347029 RepID=UPI0036850CA6
MATKPIEHHADKGTFLTLAEIEAWVRDAKAAGATGEEIVTVSVSLGSKLKKIRIDVATAVTPTEDAAP